MPDLTDLRKTDAMDREADLWVRLVAAERVVAAVRHALEHSRYAVNEDIVQAMRAGEILGWGAEAMTIDAAELTLGDMVQWEGVREALEKIEAELKKAQEESLCPDCQTIHDQLRRRLAEVVAERDSALRASPPPPLSGKGCEMMGGFIDIAPDMLAKLREAAREQAKLNTYTWIAPGHVLALLDTLDELEAERAALTVKLMRSSLSGRGHEGR